MEREKRIHYIDSFKFSFVLPLTERFRYEIIVKTTGLNKYVAGFEHRHHEWYCKNCEVRGDEVTVYVKNHNLAPGKVYCHIKIYDRDGRELESMGIDPHIFLTYDHISGPDAPNDIDTQQSIDIVRLYDKFYKIKDKVNVIEHDVDHKTSVTDEGGHVIPKMWLTTEDEDNEPVYTKEQIHERFASKDDLKKYIKAKEVHKAVKDKVDFDYLISNYYNKSEADNSFVKADDYYTKAEIDTMLYKINEAIAKLESMKN